MSSLLAIVATTHSHASAGGCPTSGTPVLQRFFAIDPVGPSQYRALRHLEANNPRYNKEAWMDVWTDADAGGFRYDIVKDGGSGFIRSRVFLPALEAEKEMWANGAPERARFTPQNYKFDECLADDSPGLARIGVKPLRKDLLLVEGSIFLRADDGDLVRVQGLLSKTPSFWTRRVEVVRRYERIAGVHLPVAMESVANVLVAGASSFKMTYDYESVNGRMVGNPGAGLARQSR